jgi:phosphotransferase system enzyme I (PtsI)
MEETKVSVISEGIAYGKIVRILNDNLFISQLEAQNKEYEKSEIKEAFEKVVSDLEKMKENSDDEFLTVHIMILKDPLLYNQVCEEIDKHNYQASKAFDTVIDRYIKQFERSESFYLEERNLDFKDIRRRVLKTLNNDYVEHLEHDKVIIVCDELYPSFISEFRNTVAGVIAKKGGTTSHGAILCKAREIPFVITDDVNFDESSNVVIDTRDKIVYSNCSEEFIEKYKKYKKSISQHVRVRDFSNQGIKISGNVSSNEELLKVRKYKLSSVGLYRTEFIFMNKNRPLTEDEQYDIYNDAVLEMKQRPITFRTFDIGDDKQLPYLKANKKGVRNYRNYPELFKDQVRALVRANRYQNLRIMFPMIETSDEFTYLKDLVVKYKNELGSNAYLKIGMMLETKEALNHLDDFKDVDFISLGTNDLTHELYNIDRNEVSNYNVYIDSLIVELKKVVEHCKRYNIELSICGEIAGVPEVTSRLLDIGIQNFSVSPALSKAIEKSIVSYYHLD